MLERNGLRLLTPGEKLLANELFFNSVSYYQVWVHHGSFLPFDMQGNHTAMTPLGEIWFESHVYQDDFFMATVDFQHLFLHEMMHVWQYQHGMNVMMRGLFSWAADYTYDFDKKRLSDYSMEQQASIVADYWLLKNHDATYYSYLIKYRNYREEKNAALLQSKYQEIMKGFPL
ncbi:hypothetical protein [Erwinia sp. 9145]|uniref:hypothetical protein n=1 Tax=Erwinia sp. 9145 TaxID=1500895 RepID=UPI00054D8153|nr:hypothetical protein [Erwinia sp. 9145]